MASILVVDDQPINVQLLKRKLEREGIQVSAAYNGVEALEVVKKLKPDLILLDVMMPDMDGIEVCQRLQADDLTRSIPIIFITARTSKEGNPRRDPDFASQLARERKPRRVRHLLGAPRHPLHGDDPDHETRQDGDAPEGPHAECESGPRKSAEP